MMACPDTIAAVRLLCSRPRRMVCGKKVNPPVDYASPHGLDIVRRPQRWLPNVKGPVVSLESLGCEVKIQGTRLDRHPQARVRP